ncbi:unnamed protein product, partial [Prorocentrum cordatum]
MADARMSDADVNDRKRRRDLEMAEERANELQQRQVILSQSSDSGFKAFLEWTFDKDDRSKRESEESRQLLQTLHEKTDKAEKAVVDLQKQQHADSARITALEQQMKNGPPSLGGASTRSGAPLDFAPSFVEAYGW